MVENFIESSADTPKPLGKKASSSSFENSLKNIQKVKYKEKIDNLLDCAKDVSKKGYQYGYTESGRDPITRKPIFVCDTLIKHIYRNAGDTSLEDIHGTREMYNRFSPDKKNRIRSQNDSSFVVEGKQLSPGDLLFYVDNQGVCGHVAMFSKIDEKGVIWIYDATKRSGVAERPLGFDEARTNSIYYTSPLLSK